MSRAGGNIYNFDAAARSAQFSHHHGIPVSIYGAHPNQLGPAAAAAVAAANTTSASQLYARDPQHYQQVSVTIVDRSVLCTARPRATGRPSDAAP